jgi:hypothetical protein
LPVLSESLLSHPVQLRLQPSKSWSMRVQLMRASLLFV